MSYNHAWSWLIEKYSFCFPHFNRGWNLELPPPLKIVILKANYSEASGIDSMSLAKRKVQ